MLQQPWKYYAKWNKSDTNGQILYDSTELRNIKQASS